MKIRKSTILYVAPIITALIIGSMSGFFAGKSYSSTGLSTGSEYDLLAKRIFVDDPSDASVNFSALRSKLNEYMSQPRAGLKPSVYFEYLPTGVSVEYNNTEVVAASLLKVPVAISIYYLVEQQKIDLNDTVQLKQEWLDSNFGDLYKKGAGYEVSIAEAIKAMLNNSDNTATKLLLSQLAAHPIPDKDGIYRYLDIELSLTQNTEVQNITITPESYASILKCLYLACYNTPEHSQEMLQLLSETTYDTRLKRYLPKDVLIAHKYGTFSNEYQSDCGIVYLDKRNYLLCVMVEGSDPAASDMIGDISKLVYDYMQNSLVLVE